MPRELKLATAILFFILTALAIGFALLMTAAAGLASMGILADVSYAENRAMVGEGAVMAGISYVVGLVLLVVALICLRSFRKSPKKNDT